MLFNYWLVIIMCSKGTMDFLRYASFMKDTSNDDMITNSKYLTSHIPPAKNVGEYIDVIMKNDKYDEEGETFRNIVAGGLNSADEMGYYKALHVACYSWLVDQVNQIINDMIHYCKKSIVYRMSSEFGNSNVSILGWSTDPDKNMYTTILKKWKSYGLELPANILIREIKKRGYTMQIKSNKTHPNEVEVKYPYIDSLEVFDIYLSMNYDESNTNSRKRPRDSD